jgi:hypothetical protein
MTDIPTYTLLIPQRASLSKRIRLPYDGTGCEVFAQVWDSDRRRKLYLDLSVEWINRAEFWDEDDPEAVRATIRLHATWEQTKGVTKDGYWDLLWVWPDDLRFYPMDGPAVVNLNATEATP